VIDVPTLVPQRHDPPAGWSPDVFQRVTESLALALVNAYQREHDEREERP
jgi:hypothetical protein